MKIKTSELTGAALDWAVAKCEGVDYRFMASTGGDYNGNWWWKTKSYSTDWSQGGPIIEREGIQLNFMRYDRPPYWTAHISREDGRFADFHSTPLIAAMRCYVASKLGDEVEVPDELA